MKEVGIIARSCGVSEPRQLNRGHGQVMGDAGLSISLVKLFPSPLKLPSAQTG